MINGSHAKPKFAWKADILEDLLNGEWIVKPPPDWRCWNLAINEDGCVGNGTLFIAIDADRWLKGSGNTGVYAGWTDTHVTLPKFQQKIVGVIVERHIKGLDPSIPQLLVEDSYEVIRILGTAARGRFTGKIIAITGTVGKSTTKRMIHHLLEAKGRVVSSHGNHNTRTGVPLTLARCITQPQYGVLEVALSALWMRLGGICQLARPHISVITEVALGQTAGMVDTVQETARMKGRIAQGIEPGGVAILNRDMEEYDLAKEVVEAWGAVARSYGFHDDADYRILEWMPAEKGCWVAAQFEGRKIVYYLPVPGKGMISNSLAAIAVVHALGIDPEEVKFRFESMPLHDSVLEPLTVDLPLGGKVHILDDSYNAEVLSMQSALEVFKNYSHLYSGKNICVLGRIVNLGNNAAVVHRELAQAVIDSGANIVFAYGSEMQYLLNELPEQMVGGLFSDIEACARAVADVVEPEDYILLKGSRRANDFGKIRQSLLKAIHNMPTEPLINKKVCHYVPYSNYCIQAIDAESGELVWTEGNPYAEADRGLGGFVLLTLLLRNISTGTIKLNEYVTITANPAKESRAPNALGLQAEEEISVFSLLTALICHNAPDAAIALAEKMAGSTVEALKLQKAWAGKLGLSEHAVENVTGRLIKAKPQSFNVEDLNKVGKRLFSLPPEYLKMLNTTTVEHKGTMFSSPSNLVLRGKIFGGYFFGKNNGEGSALAFVGGRKIILTICGARNNFQRDFLLSRVIDGLSFSPEMINRISERKICLDVGAKEKVVINFQGDTYWGESYTAIRKRRGQEDALTQYGYEHSVKAIEPLLETGDLNIANFEGVLTDLDDSPLNGIKPYVLGAKTRENIAVLQSSHVHAVTLANNHTMDYGVPGLKSMLQAFANAGIHSVGAGYNGRDANEPVRIKIRDKEIAIFNGYWYRKSAHNIFELYALGNKPGVACLSGGLIERIQQEKTNFPDSYIITIAHWGIDFKPVQPLQRNYAQQLLDCGTDLIIGHGAHMMQEIQQIDGKWVLFGIGNGVFNSNGEYDEREVPPYSFFTQLRLEQSQVKSIRIYPLFSDNLRTFWQPHPVTQEQFKEVIGYQTKIGSPMEKISIADDEYGYFMEIPLV